MAKKNEYVINETILEESERVSVEKYFNKYEKTLSKLQIKALTSIHRGKILSVGEWKKIIANELNTRA